MSGPVWLCLCLAWLLMTCIKLKKPAELGPDQMSSNSVVRRQQLDMPPLSM